VVNVGAITYLVVRHIRGNNCNTQTLDPIPTTNGNTAAR